MSIYNGDITREMVPYVLYFIVDVPSADASRIPNAKLVFYDFQFEVTSTSDLCLVTMVRVLTGTMIASPLGYYGTVRGDSGSYEINELGMSMSAFPDIENGTLTFTTPVLGSAFYNQINPDNFRDDYSGTIYYWM